ncbi:hypothetical protein bas67_0035 [Escherichia phage ErnstBeyeler]|uniref:Uncharacterized protein n=1 Tax=Escherichia phage ErnstBeyeler TaxID=2852038 RepID=A0AAE7VS27_9CAUD|nr:hypothetical protein bas67_0035 [Escherichia phage ErnstBeyeler]
MVAGTVAFVMFAIIAFAMVWAAFIAKSV